MKKIKQHGFTAIEIVIGVAVIGIIGALGWTFYNASTSKAPVSNASVTTAALLPETLPTLTDLEAIKTQAIADRPGVSVVHVELELYNDSQLVYKTQLSDGTIVVYDAQTGALLKTMTNTELSDEVLPASFVSGIGFAKALEIARAAEPGSKVYKIELEVEDGVVIYSVRFTDKSRVDVNAETGAIERTKAAEVNDESDNTKQEDDADKTPEQGGSTSDSSDDNDDSVDANEADDDDNDLTESDDDDDHDGEDRSGDSSDDTEESDRR